MHIISIFRKGRRKNSFKLYLAFFVGFTSQIPFFYSRAAFCRIWLKAILLSSVQRFCSTLSPEFWLINQHMSSRRLLSKNWKSFSQFPLTKRSCFQRKCFGQSFGSFLLLHLNRSCYSTTYISFSVHPVMECR